MQTLLNDDSEVEAEFIHDFAFNKDSNTWDADIWDDASANSIMDMFIKLNANPQLEMHLKDKNAE